MTFLSRRMVFLAAALLIVIVLSGTGVALWLYRSAALATGEAHMRNLALTLAEHARQSFQVADIALHATAEEYRRLLASGEYSEARLHRSLRERDAQLPQLRSLFVIRQNGTLAAHSKAFPAPDLSYADREDFRAHQAAQDPTFFFGAPVAGRAVRERMHPVSRGIYGADGGFLGVAAAAMDFPHFREIHRSVELGPNGRIFLFRTDGLMLASFPEEENHLGRVFGTHPVLKALPAAATGVVRGPGLIDREDRLLGYHRTSDYPLAVVVSSSEDHLLREWHKQSVYAAASALAVVAFILAAAYFWSRQLKMTEELHGEVAESERRWLQAVESAGHGVWEWDVAAGKTYRSAQYHHMLGYRDQEIAPDHEGWLALLHPDDRRTAHEATQQCVDGHTNSFSTELRLRSKDGNWKWVLNRGAAVSRDREGHAVRLLGTITDITEQREYRRQLAEREARLDAIIGSAMDAIITIDQRHTVVLFNAAAERIFRCPAQGVPGRQAVGAPLDRFIPERFHDVHRRHIEHFGETGITMRRMGEKIALWGLRADGEEFPIDASISQFEIGGEKYYTVILRDVTEQHRALEQLHDSEARLNAIIESAMDAIITVDERQTIILFNAAAERIFGCASNVAIGTELDRFIPHRYRVAHRAHIERFGDRGETMRRMGANMVLTGLRADGEEFPIDASISQVVVGGRRFYTVILRDVTQREKAAAQIEESHRELRELYGVMNEVREAERIRIARELHDELAQWLTALKMDVSWIAARLPPDMTRLADKTAKMKEVVDTTVAAVRRIASDLRPVMIDDLGLIPAVEHLLHDFSERSAIRVSLDTRTDHEEFRDPVATAVYRMVQEALTNVTRHAEATRVGVTLAVEDSTLLVRIQDNGRGIDETALRRTKSYGVLGIRERAQTLGGHARIYKAEEGGTAVDISIPLRAQHRTESAA